MGSETFEVRVYKRAGGSLSCGIPSQSGDELGVFCSDSDGEFRYFDSDPDKEVSKKLPTFKAHCAVKISKLSNDSLQSTEKFGKSTRFSQTMETTIN